MNTWLVTGGTGFIGTHIVNELIKTNKVYVCGPKRSTKGTWIAEDYRAIPNEILKECQYVSHQAAISDTMYDDEKNINLVNFSDAIYFFKKCANLGVKSIVYASSCSIYGDSDRQLQAETDEHKPLNFYAKSKSLLELELQKRNFSIDEMKITALRYSNVFGSGEWCKRRGVSMVSQLAKQLIETKNANLFTDGNQTRDFIPVREAVKANIEAINKDTLGVFNCGVGVAISFNDVVKTLAKLLNINDYTVSYFENFLKGKYQSHTQCNMEKFKKVFGFIPQVVEEDWKVVL